MLLPTVKYMVLEMISLYSCMMLGLAKVFTTTATSPKNPVQPRTVRIFPRVKFSACLAASGRKAPGAKICFLLLRPFCALVPWGGTETDWTCWGDAVGKEIQERKNTNQVIQSDPTWSPKPWPFDPLEVTIRLWKGHVFTISKRSRLESPGNCLCFWCFWCFHPPTKTKQNKSIVKKNGIS